MNKEAVCLWLLGEVLRAAQAPTLRVLRQMGRFLPHFFDIFKTRQYLVSAAGPGGAVVTLGATNGYIWRPVTSSSPTPDHWL